MTVHPLQEMTSMQNLNESTKDAWDANAEVWDQRMGDAGNDFFNLLCWTPLASLLDPNPGDHILDIACGNGLTTRRLAELGVKVTAFDFSAKLIEYAKQRTSSYASRITYHVIDATDQAQLLSTLQPLALFDSALSNMALFDMADVEPLFRALPKLLKPGGSFVFSITHPCFNNASSAHIVEEIDNNGEMQITYSVKVSRYMTTYSARGLALRNQPVPQIYFERPLQYYLNLGFQNGFFLDGFEERAFPPETPQVTPLGWGGKFSEIPAVIVARMRLTN
jgi:2-polyprenyl-3-methyl-5-hydroxy-6-metoxy-1,4-benzoquinol methylase